MNEQEIVGYCCIIIGDEPAYSKIEGTWKTDGYMLSFIKWLLIRRQEGEDYPSRHLI